MSGKYVLMLIMFAVLVAGCSKKHQPQSVSTNANAAKTEEEKKVSVKNTVPVKTVKKFPVAKTITVDDRAAKQMPDGRMYYDLDGRRYWKNYNDGKYYLFSKKMYEDPAFKPH